MECGKTRNDFLRNNASNIYIKLKKYYAEKFNETTGIEIPSRNSGGNSQLSMEGIAV